MRLVGGETSSGRLEFCAGGVWGRVCNSNYWGHDNAKVVCRQLAFSEQGKIFLRQQGIINFSLMVLGASVADPDLFGTGEKYRVIGEVECVGTESELLECFHTPIGEHYCNDVHVPDIAIHCTGECMIGGSCIKKIGKY